MYGIIARETEIARSIADLLLLQRDYHANVASILGELMGGVETALSSASVRRPLYGAPLPWSTTVDNFIAPPLELTVCALIASNSLDEEGLFRMAGSASKVHDPFDI
jgi:hypothetical protein